MMMTKREIRRRIKLYKELIKFCQRSKINECKKAINIWYWKQKIENLSALLSDKNNNKKSAQRGYYYEKDCRTLYWCQCS